MTENKWISVKDRLPEEDGIYIAYPTMTGNVYPVRYFKGFHWRTIMGSDVWDAPTHWMPLPEPPEANDDRE